MGRTLSSDANVIALPASPTGFSAGDYVYQTRTGYGAVPAGSLATGMFDVGSIPTPVHAATASSSNELTYVEQLGGSMGSQVAAQLTNTNIVYAYGVGDTVSFAGVTTVNFRIETTAGASVVAQTSTTMQIQGPNNVSVVALPAGGFCIVGTTNNGSNYTLSARFYNADGTAATALLNGGLSLAMDPSVSRLKLQPLSDGSVIIGYVNGPNVEMRRVTTTGFDATFGTSGLYTLTASGAQALNSWDYLVDGSNNIQAILTTSSTVVTMRRINSSGVQQTSSNVVTLTGVAGVAIVRTSDGTIRGIVQDGSGITTLTWDGTTAAVGTRIITASTPPDRGALAAFAQGGSGGYVVFYNTFLGSSAAFGLHFQAFSSANASLAPATRVNSMIAVNYRNQFVPIVISGNTRVYFGVYQANGMNYPVNNCVSPMGIAYFAYSNTTFALVGAPTAGYAWGSQGPFALGAYMRSASTAAVARFTVASTGSYPINLTANSLLIQKTVVDNTATSSRVSLAPLPNGEFVAVWARNSGGATFISKYSQTGVRQIGPVTVNATGDGNSMRSACVATFANGNILVVYSDTASALRFRIYTPSLTVVTSGDIDTACNLAAVYVTCTSFGDGDHVAVLFNDNNNFMSVRAVRSTGTVTARLGASLTAASSWNYPQVIGLKSSAFAIMAYDANAGTTAIRGYFVRKTAANTFLAGTEQSFASPFGNMGGAPCPGSPIPTPGTSAYFVGANNSNNAYRLLSVNPIVNGSTQLSWSDTTGLFSNSLSSINGASLGYTANGTPVLVAHRGLTNFLTVAPITSPLSNTAAGPNTPTTGGFATTLATSGSQSFVSVIPHIGEAVLVGYADDAGFVSFASINVLPFTVNATLTAGTDISTTPLILSPEAGFSLQGVAVTGASSGSSGLVQTRGSATLNSNYSAATTATTFDFRNPLTSGTYGTIIGRNVIMGN